MISLLLGIVLGIAAPVEGQESKQDKTEKPGKSIKPKEAKNAVRKAVRPTHREKLPQFTPARETSSLAFVKEQHSQLIAVLERLKSINPEEYQWAIREIAADIDQLNVVKARDAKEYAIQLEGWRLRSQVGLAAADLSSKRTEQKEQKLRDLLNRQMANQIQQQELECERLRARLAGFEKKLIEMQATAETTIESRYQRLAKRRPNRSAKEGTIVKEVPPAKEGSQKLGEQKEENK